MPTELQDADGILGESRDCQTGTLYDVVSLQRMICSTEKSTIVAVITITLEPNK